MKRPRRPVAPSTARDALAAVREGDEATPAPVRPGAQPAPLVVVLPPSAFAPDWKGRPTEPARIGLRLVSEAVNDQARADATASADRHFQMPLVDVEAYVAHWNGVAMRGVLAQAMCQEHDVSESWFRSMAADAIGVALVERGIQRLWQGYEELRDRLSPLLVPASGDDLAALGAILAGPDAVGRVNLGDRRILARILDDLRAPDTR